MKYYETHYEEYIQSVKKHNIHPELTDIFDQFPKTIKELGNLIVYGPSGSGKYSQVLYLLEKYSPTHLKYDKRITVNTEKQTYIYRISDIHYEIDMGLLGCHSKLLWHELFFQVVDIISMKSEKTGILVCRNFHMIHSELLEVFYSYIQQSTKLMQSTCIRFILLTEHISFIPNNILNCCEQISVCKPTKTDYINVLFGRAPENEDRRTLRKTIYDSERLEPQVPESSIRSFTSSGNASDDSEHSIKEECECLHEMFVQQISETKNSIAHTTHNGSDKIVIPNELRNRPDKVEGTQRSTCRSKDALSNANDRYKQARESIDEMAEKNVLNLKELQLFTQTTPEHLPKDIFNVICDNIICEITNSQSLVFTNFRENLYDILIYNLDITECVWYILSHFISVGSIVNTTEILPTVYTFLKYYNNNYRPIYHLESILFYLLLEVRKQQPVNENEQKTRILLTRNNRNEFTSKSKRNTRPV